MGFIERLRQELALEAQRVEQKAAQEKADQEAKEKARLQAEVAERERRAPRRQQAAGFQAQSGVGAMVAELRAFLAIPARGGASEDLVWIDPDSVFEWAQWDIKHCGNSGVKSGWNEHFSEKYIAVETCPNGTIVFHGGWRSSTTIPLTKWRDNKNRELIFDKALEKAFKNPKIHRFSVYHYSPPDDSFKM